MWPHFLLSLAFPVAPPVPNVNKELLTLCVQPGSDAQIRDVTRLLAVGASPLYGDMNRNTCSYFAAAMGNIEVLRLVLNVDTRTASVSNVMGQTPLHVAVTRARTNVVSLLLERGADPYAARGDHSSALDLALAAGDADMVTLLEGWEFMRDTLQGTAKERAAQDAALSELTEAHSSACTAAERWESETEYWEAAERERLDAAIAAAREVGVEPVIVDPIAQEYLSLMRRTVSPQGELQGEL